MCLKTQPSFPNGLKKYFVLVVVGQASAVHYARLLVQLMYQELSADVWFAYTPVMSMLRWFVTECPEQFSRNS